MAKMKVYELKDQMNEKLSSKIESKDILAYLEGKGVKKSHSSGLEETEVSMIKHHFMPDQKPQANTSVKKAEVTQNSSNSLQQEKTQGPVKRMSQYSQGIDPRGNNRSNSNNGNNSQSNNNRPQGDRPQGSYQGNRPQGQGYQGNNRMNDGQRQSGYQGNRQQGDRPQGGYQGNRQNGERDGQRQGGYQGNRNQGDRPQGGYQGNRPQGDRPQGGYQGNRSYGDGQRQGGYQGNRSQGDRPQGGYQGNRPQGDRPQGGYQGNRSYGDGQRQGSYQGNRPQGDRPQGGYQGNRPQGDRPQGGYQGNRPQGGYQGNRPQGDRPQGGYQGNRGGYGDKDGQRQGGYQGNRSQGGSRGNSERKNFDQQIFDQKVAEQKDLNNKRTRDRMNKEKNQKDNNAVNRKVGRGKDNRDYDDDDMVKPKTAVRKKGQFIKPEPVAVVVEEVKTITIPEVLTLKELADKMKQPAGTLVKKLFLAGKMVSINSEITFEEAEEIALEYDIIAEKEEQVNIVEELLKENEEDPATMVKRPPVVCVMGHVDHGKTSLLDAIRATHVTEREAGGITQHIGAYQVEINGEPITFLDTPGHEAFTSMRMRGAQSTDIAILVVAADDGVMPQTVEAINHAKAAGVQIIVAINKIDKPSANLDKVKQELTEHELVPEDWGGDTIFVPVSAHTKEGIKTLLEMIVLTAEILELKANPDRKARGLVIEAELDKGRGPVATVLVQKGTLNVGDNIAVGSAYGKVRAMMDDKGRRVKTAGPSTPIEILGLNEVPDAGEIFIATDNDKEARNIAEAFISQGREKLLADTKAKLSLDGLFSQIKAGNIKELNIIIKADVQGSVEAVKQSLLKLSNEEVAVRVIHGGVGAINESDVTLASASNAIIIGFNVRPDNTAKEIADREKVDLRLYRVIYQAIEDVEAAMKGMLDPTFEEKVIGHAEVRQVFKASGLGMIAGSYVLDGKIVRGCSARITREGVQIYDGALASLKRFKDDVKEVATGYECGLVFEKFNDLQEFDQVELYMMVEVPR